MTRKEAIRLGLFKYLTGKPCSRGHMMLRYTGTGACIGCIRVYQREAIYKKSAGFIRYKFELLDKQDEAIVREFVDSINAARKIMKII